MQLRPIFASLAPFTLGTLVGSVLPDSARAQSLVWTATSPAEEFGVVIDCLGDIDRDAAEDFAIARRDAVVEIRSGRNGSVVRVHTGPPGSDDRNVVGIGDVDGDATGDYAIGARQAWTGSTPWTGWYGVFSGGGGGLLWEEYGVTRSLGSGSQLAAPGDLNGDSIPDLVVGVGAFSRNAGRGEARDGRTGQLLWAMLGSSTPLPQQLGWRVSACRGDVDADGRPDVLAMAADPLAIVQISGATGKEVRRWVYVGPEFRDIDGLGDTDGDGVADYVVGVFDGTWESGAALVYSGATSGLRYRVAFDEGPWTAFGGKVKALGDLTGDGIQEFGVGTRGTYVYVTRGHARVYDGATGALRKCMEASVENLNFGFELSAGDADGDGHRDILVGAPRYEGRVEIFGVLTGGAIREQAPACGPGRLSLAGQPRLGNSLGVRVCMLDGLGPRFIGIGTLPLQLPYCGCFFGHEWGITLPAGSLWLPIPNDPLLVQAEIGLQGIELLASGGCADPQMVLSQTLFVTIGW